MKKLLICFFSIILILSSAIISYADSLSCSVGIVCNSTKISKNTKKIEIQVNLDSYNGDGTLGYEGKIEYDSNVFESVTIKQAENWEAVSYEAQTGKFVSTTTNAKAGNVATIVLKVKEGVTANTTDVVITNLTFSDGESTIMLNKTITFSIEKNTEDNGGNNSGNNDNNKDEIDNNKNDNKNDGKNDEKNNGNDNNNKNDNKRPSNTDDKNNPNNDKKENTIIVTPVDKEKADSSTAISKIPQTGEFSIPVAILIIGIIGIICYIRYRSIQIK